MHWDWLKILEFVGAAIGFIVSYATGHWVGSNKEQPK